MANPSPSTSSASSPFPLIFFDGKSEINAGIIFLHPSLNFKTFITLISQKIGISPHRISASLANAASIRCKVPIDESSDFAKIANQRNCFIFADLKSSVSVCPDCAAAEEQGILSPEFHLCVNDPIVVGFRTKAGPIQRPSKPN